MTGERLLLAGLSAATAVVLAGCGVIGGGTAASGASASGSAGGKPCSQQYKAWADGPAGKAVVSEFLPALHTAFTDAQDNAFVAVVADIESLGIIAAQLAPFRMPACADPKGYWAQSLRYLGDAGQQARAATSTAGIGDAASLFRKGVSAFNNLITEFSGVPSNGGGSRAGHVFGQTL
jgi:hypothetical protein